MFLWWSKKETTSVKEAIEEEQHEVDDLKQELAAASLARPSGISKAKYNKWLVAEDNRSVGTTMRQEHEGSVSQRDEMRNEFLEATHERTAQTRQQREATLERVRAHRAAMQERGKQVKSMMTDHQATTRSHREAYQQYGQRNAQIYGTEQRERLLEARMHQDEQRRLAAQSQKQAMIDRAEAFQAQTERQISERRERVQRIRDETKPEAAELAKMYFVHGRKAIADDVRESVSEWKKEAAANQKTALQLAKVNRAGAEETRKKVIDGRKVLQEQRKQDATQMRDSIKQIELHRDHMKLSTEFTKREGHDSAFEGRFVAPEHAIAVERSSYDTLANTHREELAARDKPPREVSRPNWVQYFGNTHDGGFFKSGSSFWWW